MKDASTTPECRVEAEKVVMTTNHRDRPTHEEARRLVKEEFGRKQQFVR